MIREANSHEEFSVGFWPGSGTVTEAAFYARSASSPDAAVLEFFQTAYDAAADPAGWDRAVRDRPPHGWP